MIAQLIFICKNITCLITNNIVTDVQKHATINSNQYTKCKYVLLYYLVKEVMKKEVISRMFHNHSRIGCMYTVQQFAGEYLRDLDQKLEKIHFCGSELLDQCVDPRNRKNNAKTSSYMFFFFCLSPIGNKTVQFVTHMSVLQLNSRKDERVQGAKFRTFLILL